MQSPEWKLKRVDFLSGDVHCYSCGVEKWKYRIWQCNFCGGKFLGDKWDYKPYCEYCEGYDGEQSFKQITDGSEYFQLHHLTYKNLSNEKEGDLIILCEDCHRLAHNLIGIYPKNLNIANVPDYIKKEKTRCIAR